MGGNNYYLGKTVDRLPGIDPKTFGHIPGVKVGTTWETRIDCSNAGVHSYWQSGISGTKDDGAYSIVVAGGYEDRDEGKIIHYTGQGGFIKKGGENVQVRDQEWKSGNLALRVSLRTGKPVRVVRGFQAKTIHAPSAGYRYDGLYKVVAAEEKQQKSGFMICKFTLEKLEDEESEDEGVGVKRGGSSESNRDSPAKRRRLSEDNEDEDESQDEDHKPTACERSSIAPSDTTTIACSSAVKLEDHPDTELLIVPQTTIDNPESQSGSVTAKPASAEEHSELNSQSQPRLGSQQAESTITATETCPAVAPS
ncbi:hypothetical protein HGRIS_009601 [Hohenbuehelia grisea]|uniref:YDG domain-containing protein n=1 Tax=Hohenbuehelia grisea TaxID=104357 RepID=A0ABR3J1Y6_9AGAR